jgi:hypothetical protein
MDKNSVFVVTNPDGTAIAETASPDKREAILRFFAMDGNAKYINRGWMDAMAEGYGVAAATLIRGEGTNALQKTT